MSLSADQREAIARAIREWQANYPHLMVRNPDGEDQLAEEVALVVEPLVDGWLGEARRDGEGRLAAIIEAVEDADRKAVKMGDGEWVEGYQFKTGAWHRLLGIARGTVPGVVQDHYQRGRRDEQERIKAGLEAIPAYGAAFDAWRTQVLGFLEGPEATP